MSAPYEAIEELATGLNRPEAPAFPYVPEDIIPPAIVLQPAEEFLGDIETYGGSRPLSVEAYLVVELANGNENAAQELDELLGHVLDSLPVVAGGEWGLDSMRAPGPIHVGDLWAAHALPVTLSRFITL